MTNLSVFSDLISRYRLYHHRYNPQHHHHEGIINENAPTPSITSGTTIAFTPYNSRMNSLEVWDSLRHIPAQTKGVFPADRIPNRWSRPAAIVANTDDHTKPGTHWVALYVDSKGHGVFFDSYGNPPLVAQHHNRLRRNSNSYEWNTRGLQSLKSRVCGEYCLMFLDHMSRGRTLAAFSRKFTENRIRNDKMVANYYKRLKNSRRKNKNVKRVRNNNNHRNYNYNNIRGGGFGASSNCIQSCTSRVECYK